jgi:hypothetical protein
MAGFVNSKNFHQLNTLSGLIEFAFQIGAGRQINGLER